MECLTPNCTKIAVSPHSDPKYCREHYFDTEEWKNRMNECALRAGVMSTMKYAQKKTKEGIFG